jgi:hypothetical protein
MSKPAAPPRSPERQRLADAIERHTAALQNHDRVTEAERKLTDEYFDVLLPAVTEAEERLAEARERAPEALVAAALGEPAPEGPSVAEAEAALAEAGRRAAECRAARALLAAETQRAEAAVNGARFGLDTALPRAVSADLARAALLAEFRRAARRALRIARAIQTSGLRLGGIEAHGMRADIGEAVVAVGQRAFRDDPEWLAAIANLRQDPDAALPGLPPEGDPDDDAGDRDDRAAA